MVANNQALSSPQRDKKPATKRRGRLDKKITAAARLS